LKKFFKLYFVYGFLLYIALNLIACSEPLKDDTPQFLIKTAIMQINVEEFSEELDLKRASYPYTIDEAPAEYNEMVIRLVKTLSEEIVLLSAAQTKGVTLTDQEIQSAEDEFKKDYPDDSFEQILLKNARSYSFWKKRFKKNLIVDKLIEQEVKQKIKITSQDIINFYKTYNKDKDLKKIEDENELISSLKRQKTQDNYDDWMQTLKNENPIEINKEKLKTLLLDIEKSEAGKNE
jgi:hypothetical protein